MFTLTMNEAMDAVIRFARSLDIFGPMKYFSGRDDVGTMGILSSDAKGHAAALFVVVWKNGEGIHCKSEVIPKAGALFRTRLIFKDGQQGISDVELTQVDEKSGIKWLN